MKIAIDIKAALGRQKSGIGNYVFNLIEHLIKIDHKNDYFLITPNKQQNVQFLLKSNSNSNSNFKFRNRYSVLNYFQTLDVVHGPDFKIPSVNAAKKVVTILDLASFVNNGFMSKKFEELTKQKVITAVNSADRIITISNTIKNLLEQEFPSAKGKITTVYLGLSENVSFVSDDRQRESVRNKYNLPERFILFVGNIETRKNILDLLNAFIILKDKAKIKTNLVLVGKDGYGFEAIRKFIDDNLLASNVKLLGWVEDKDLYTIYSLAELLVFPSYYEGFGLPIIEAMRCKLPIILSDIPTHREIAQEAADYFNIKDENQLADTILKLLNNKTVKDELIIRGYERSLYFDWQKTAAQTLSIYKSINC